MSWLREFLLKARNEKKCDLKIFILFYFLYTFAGGVLLWAEKWQPNLCSFRVDS